MLPKINKFEEIGQISQNTKSRKPNSTLKTQENERRNNKKLDIEEHKQEGIHAYSPMQLSNIES